MLVLEVLGWLLADLVLVSLGEYVAHRWFMHRPWLRAFHKPHALHHFRYYTIFDHEPHPAGKHLNLRITWPDTLLACLVAAPLALLSPLGYAILFALACLHRWVWNAIHSEMHLHAGRWFAELRVYRWLAWYHFLHHRHPTRNFNVTLPLMDLLFGTRALHTADDLSAWYWLPIRRRLEQIARREAA